jgi:predicted RNA binding protein YcfA (HicA-like mRNA interferase family)
MPRKYPVLTLNDITAILSALGFVYSKSRGGHDFYKGFHSEKNCKVTVDPKCAPFDDFLIKSMIRQSGYSREEFYGATPSTLKKIADTLPKDETSKAL